MSFKGVDASEVNALVSDLRDAPTRKPQEIRASLFKGGLNIKKRATQIIADSRAARTNIPGYPYSIDFEQKDGGFTIEVGPLKAKKQGALGNLLEYGGKDFAPIPHLQPALDEEIPRTEKWLKKIAGDLL